MAEFVKVAKKSEIPDDTGKFIEVNGKEIALFKACGRVYALYSVCPHQGGPLAEGGFDGKVVTCPWHGWQFDVTNGECAFDPSVKQETFSVKEEDEDIFVQV